MKVYGLTLMLRDDPGAIERYKEYHRNVWPEVAARIRQCGIQTMRIFLLQRHMFMYIETDDAFDPAVDFARINEAPRSQEWDTLMRSLQEVAPEAAPGEWWALMEQVFELS